MNAIRPHLLLVEHESVRNDILNLCLDTLGIPLTGPANTVETARVLYEDTTPSLVVITATPALAPADSVKLVRLLLDIRYTPIVFLTSTLSDASFIRKALPQQVVCVAEPYTPAYLQRVLQVVMAQSRLSEGLKLAPTAPVEVVKAALPSPHLFVRERGMLIRLEPTLIACVETAGKYCLITMANGHRYTVRVPLRELLTRFEPAQFVQAQRCWMVNLQYVDFIDPVASTIHLVGGAEVPLGRTHRESFFKQLNLVD
jgi:DNA-binding LytR/AlgR family response regulator